MSSINILCMGCMNKRAEGDTCPFCGYRHLDNDVESSVYLAPGTILNDRYILGKVLGVGGFGITYIGFDPKLEVKLAVKEYFPRHISARAQGKMELNPYEGDSFEKFRHGLKYFLREVKTAAKFEHHPNVVAVKDYFEENNTAYMVMSYIDGNPLDKFLEKSGGRISYKIALKIALPIMDALEKIHAKNLLHRDISPDNIYMASNGVPMLIDFGASRYTETDQSQSMTLTLKEGYAPLEQYSKNGDQGPWTDVYALSATIYHSITGKTPPAAMERLPQETLVSPADMGISLPAHVEEAILKGLALSIPDRFSSVTDFKSAIVGRSGRSTVGFIEKIFSLPGALTTFFYRLSPLKIISILSLLVVLLATVLFFRDSGASDTEESSKKVSKVKVEKIEKSKVKKKKRKKVRRSKSRKLKKGRKKRLKKGRVKKSRKIKVKSRKIAPEKRVKAENKVTKKASPPSSKGVSVVGKKFSFERKQRESLTPVQYFKRGRRAENSGDRKTAQKSYSSACKGSHPTACYKLGQMTGKASYFKRARRLFNLECKSGRGYACMNLGVMMGMGEGGSANSAGGVEKLRKSCNLKYAPGCARLADIYQNGKVVKKSLKKSKQYRKKACKYGIKRLCR
jgi:serine/threonine protein kinase